MKRLALQIGVLLVGAAFVSCSSRRETVRLDPIDVGPIHEEVDVVAQPSEPDALGKLLAPAIGEQAALTADVLQFRTQNGRWPRDAAELGELESQEGLPLLAKKFDIELVDEGEQCTIRSRDGKFVATVKIPPQDT